MPPSGFRFFRGVGQEFPRWTRPWALRYSQRRRLSARLGDVRFALSLNMRLASVHKQSMCGFWASFGVVAPQGALDAVRSRGPDGRGAFDAMAPEGPVSFRFARLAIFDTSPLGDQPMHVQRRWGAGTLSIVFNGAIYNYLELRQELEEGGVSFRSKSDTEVVLAAWDRWGVGALARFDGMFAFALYDSGLERLFVARDRMGEKPLHWAMVRVDGRRGLAFASDLRQLLPFLPQGADLNHDVAGDFLNLGLCDRGDATFVRQIERAPAGSWAEIDLRAPLSRPAFNRWWRPCLPGNGASESLGDDLAAAVTRTLRADVPVGACVSGGLDSSIIASLAQRIAPGRMTAICAVYDDPPEISERPYIDMLIKHTGLDVICISPDSCSLQTAIPRVVRDQGEPFANLSIVLQWFLFQEAKAAGLKVMLDGQAADELFAGYWGMAAWALADRICSGDVISWWRESEAFAAGGTGLRAATLRKASVSALLPEEVARFWERLNGRWPSKDWIAPEAPPRLLQSPYRHGNRLDVLVRKLALQDALPALLRYEDRNAMAHSIESRLPYLSSPVLDSAFRTSGRAKMKDGWSKAVLRSLAAGHLPETIVRRRPKLGFATPACDLTQGSWRAWIEERLSAPPPPLDPARLASMRDRMGQTGVDAALFRAAIFAEWHSAFRIAT